MAMRFSAQQGNLIYFKRKVGVDLSLTRCIALSHGVNFPIREVKILNGCLIASTILVVVPCCRGRRVPCCGEGDMLSLPQYQDD